MTLLPPTGFAAELTRRMETNDPSLRSLVMDGLSLTASMTRAEMEILFDALGGNASVRRLSMRNSGVDDDVASLLALALVDNTSLTQLNLYGNDMTIKSAMSFHAVLQRGNDTLRHLDMGGNHPSIDDGVETALCQFMNQRALKSTLTGKAEWARRAARGMTSEEHGDDDDDDGDGADIGRRVTMVCPQSVIDEIFADASGVDDGGGAEEDGGDRYERDLDGGRTVAGGRRFGIFSKIDDWDIASDGPDPGETFREYTRRLKRMEREMGASSGEDDASVVSVSDRSLTSLSSLPSDAVDDMLSEIQQLRLLYERHKESQRPDSLPSNIQGNASIGSSITPFSAEAENDVRSVQSNGMPLEPVLEQEAPSTSVAGGGAAGPRAPPLGGQIDNFGGSSESHSSSSGIANNVGYYLRMSGIRSKTEEKMRRSTSTRAVGAQHIDEVAPSRQNRRGTGQRGRLGRTESQRRRRLAELESEGAGATAVATSGGGDVSGSAGAAVGGGDVALLDADVELADLELDEEFQQGARKESRLSVNMVLSGVIASLVVTLLCLIIIYAI